MIQRIQTLYLFIVTALMVAMAFLPLATVIVDENTLYTLVAFGLKPLEGGALVSTIWALFAMEAIIALISLVTIFLFRKRILQIRLTVFNILLMIGFYGLFIYLVFNPNYLISGDNISFTYKFALCFPFVSMILSYLAIRNIGADEALVRSLDRLR